MKGYAEDLAYVHDRGFGDFARKASPGLLELLRENDVGAGSVVDLGCGSGIWARALTDAGYAVLGIDGSAAMVALARKQAPRAYFRRGSFMDAKLPRCDAITALGEVFNYTFDPRARRGALPRLFKTLHVALRPGGLLIFDVAGPDRARGTSRTFVEGKDWTILYERENDARLRRLTRRVTVFRKRGSLWRRSDEVHVQELHRPAEIARSLRAAGFRVRYLRNYGSLRFPKGLTAFVARR